MRRRTLSLFGAAVVLVLGIGAGVAYAVFSAQGTGSGTASVGTLAMTNSDPGTYVVTFTGEYPGYSQSGSLTLTNSGNVPAGAMSLTVGAAANQTCATNLLGCAAGVGTSNDLSGVATISVVDTTTTKTVLPATSIDFAHGHGSYPLNSKFGGASWLVGEAHTFTVTVSVPASAGNAYQGTSTNFALTFNGTVG